MDIVISRSQDLAVAITEYEGVHKLFDRHAIGVAFTVRTSDGTGGGRIVVLFSAAVRGQISWEPYGFREPGDEDERLRRFALAAIGEYLDKNGLPPYTPAGQSASEVPCFSPQLRAWESSLAADDDDIERYLRSKLYWSWRFDAKVATFAMEDFLRLGVKLETVSRVAVLGDGRDWRRAAAAKGTLALEPTPEFVQAERTRRRTPTQQRVAPAIMSRKVFIIHGHDDANTLRLKELLRERFRLEPIVMKFEAGRGRTLIEKFESEASGCEFAFALLTPDDTVRTGSDEYTQARPNVVFELGWFCGHRTRQNVALVVKEGTKIHSDLDGLSRIDFKTSVEEKILEIERELVAAGLHG